MRKIDKAFKAYLDIEEDIRFTITELIQLKQKVLREVIDKKSIADKIDMLIERLNK